MNLLRKNLIPWSYASAMNRGQWITKNNKTIRGLRSKSNKQRQMTLEDLASIVGKENASNAKSVREHYGKDESRFSSVMPDFVVWPMTIQHVSKICRMCYEMNVPMTPFGTGTGLEGGVNAMKGGVCIALHKMDKIIEVNNNDFDCTVEAGVTHRQLNDYLSGTGLFFPVDPGASACIGGMAATGASGTSAVFYRTMKENVLNMDVVLPNGDILKTGGINGRAKKSSAGYNLTELFIGSEGTLGLIVKLTLRLYPLPESTSLSVFHFETDQQAIETVVMVLQHGIPVSRIEYVDRHSIQATNIYSKMTLAEKPSIFLELGGSPSSIEAMAEIVKEIVQENGGLDFKHATGDEQKNLWRARHDLYYACRHLDTRPDHKAIITDCCVPISRLADIVGKMRSYLDQYKLNGFSFGHVGDGNFHTVITYDPNDQTELQNVTIAYQRIAQDAIQMGGTCTGEHGIGRGKKDSLNKQFDPVALDLMRRLKQTIDPKNLLNPGKVLPG